MSVKFRWRTYFKLHRLKDKHSFLAQVKINSWPGIWGRGVKIGGKVGGAVG